MRRVSGSVFRLALLLASTSLWANAHGAPAPAIKPADIDRIVERTMAAYPVPGIAVGVVKDGKLIYAKGFGVRLVGQPEGVDADTMFSIGSNTKAFTTGCRTSGCTMRGLPASSPSATCLLIAAASASALAT